jgi:diguanylate cyclase (GGDEF)-like protein
MLHAEQREIERLAAVERYDILDTPREEVFDRITALACRVLEMPMAAFSAIDGHRQWYKASKGLAAPECPKNQTFCVYALTMHVPLVVSDARLDTRFADNASVGGEPGVRSYLGIPLTTRDGHNIGTLCAVGTEPRTFSEVDIANLTDLARIGMDALEYRLLANTDPLTEVLSRRGFKNEADRAVALALRHHHPLSAIALDLDHFKSINDTHGHEAGDRVISETVRACVRRARQTDIAGRLGGEEFAFILPHTDRAAATEVAEQMRETIESLGVEHGSKSLRVTASFGIAALDHATRDVEELLRKADAALYEAKAAGRNQCKVAPVAADRRDAARRRVFKGGQIIFNNRTSTVDCTVRSLSATGAGLDISSSVGLPKNFLLSIRSDNLEVPCQVISWAERHIEVEFTPLS